MHKKIKPMSSNTRIVTGLNSGRRGSTLIQTDQAHVRRVPSLEAASTRHIHHPHYAQRQREVMIQFLRQSGIGDEKVLKAMQAVPRHLFVIEAFRSRAYENISLSIGHEQTISQPWVVARMLEVINANHPKKVLEIGTGCGYQAAVMSEIFSQVYSVERIKPLYDGTCQRLKQLGYQDITLRYGDGMLGMPDQAPFDAIVLAAAGLAVPRALLMQLSIGGRLIAPIGAEQQSLVLVERLAQNDWKQTLLDKVFFVPLLSGVQT